MISGLSVRGLLCSHLLIRLLQLSPCTPRDAQQQGKYRTTPRMCILWNTIRACPLLGFCFPKLCHWYFVQAIKFANSEVNKYHHSLFIVTGHWLMASALKYQTRERTKKETNFHWKLKLFLYYSSCWQEKEIWGLLKSSHWRRTVCPFLFFQVQILGHCHFPICRGLWLVTTLLTSVINPSLGNSLLFPCDGHIRKEVRSCCRMQLRSIGA